MLNRTASIKLQYLKPFVYKQMSIGWFKNLFTNYIHLKYINRIYHELTYKSWYAVKYNQPTEVVDFLGQIDLFKIYLYLIVLDAI